MRYFWNMARLLFFSLLWVISPFRISCQENLFPDYHPPLGIPLVLSANFGELRPNHFHMGVDFKTNGQIGYKLYAIDEGYVSRIKVSPYGYGKVLYINHPNGTTSVYAHCNEFKGRIDSLVRAIQYKTERFEVEIFPAPEDLVVQKGEVIAISGNTGGSTAPHLHFEIRDTETEDCLNPLVYGFDIADHRPPTIRFVKAFPINEEGYLRSEESREAAVRSASGMHTISGNEVVIPGHFLSPSGGIGLAFDIVDQLDGASNQCGLYGTYLIVDGDTLFGQRTDRISFNTTRYINTHRDLSARNRKYHKSYRTAVNPLEIYTVDGLGIIHGSPGTSKKVKLIAFDPKGNTSELNFVLRIGSESMSADYKPDSLNHLLPAQSFSQQETNWSVWAPENTLYEPEKRKKSSVNAHFCEVGIPLQKGVEVRLKAENADYPLGKYYIAARTESGSLKPLETTVENDWLLATSTHSGSYSVHIDTISPQLKALSYTNAYVITSKRILFNVYENQTSLEEYDLYIDGKWHLMEYEPKGDQLFFDRPDELKGTHDIKIVLTDSCGNQLLYERALDFR